MKIQSNHKILRAAYPYHYRDNDPATDPQQFADVLKDQKGIEVRMRNWY